MHRLLAPLVVLCIERDATARARTWDNLGNNQVLYQLSYGGFTPT